jgi:hypothetical protein
MRQFGDAASAALLASSAAVSPHKQHLFVLTFIVVLSICPTVSKRSV